MSYTSLRAAGHFARPAFLALAALAAFAIFVAMPAGSASAHAAYDHSSPDDGEVVADSPPTITVVFKEEAARGDGLPTLVVVNDSGDEVSSNAVLNDDDRTMMTADLDSDLPDGRYAILWHTVSADDGEEAMGAAFFYVGEGPSETTPAAGGASPTLAPTSPPSSSEDDDSDGVSVVALIGGIIGGLVVGAGGGLFFGRRG